MYLETLRKELTVQGLDLATHLSKDVVLTVFSYLDYEDLSNCLLVSRQWKKLTDDHQLWNRIILNRFAFGKKQWEIHIGQVGIEPPLPPHIYSILKSPCVFFPNKRVGNTHVLTLIPKSVNQQPLNLSLFEKLNKQSNLTYPFEGKGLSEKFIEPHMNQSPHESYWVLMAKDLISQTKELNSTNQTAFLKGLNEQSQIKYEIPSYLEALTCVYIHNNFSQKIINPSQSIRCKEELFVCSKAECLSVNMNNHLNEYQCQEQAHQAKFNLTLCFSSHYMTIAVTSEEETVGIAPIYDFKNPTLI